MLVGMELTQRLCCPSMPSLLMRIPGLELSRAGRRLRRRMGWLRPPALPVERFAAPDSALARQAAALVHELSAPFLEHHCHRTWAFGVALAIQHGRSFDAELLYLASLLHDLGLTDAHQGDAPFELRGARAARAWCLEHGVPQARAGLVHEAIALHTSLIAATREPEIAYVHLGAGADVFGYHIEEVSRATADGIVEAWPRVGFKESLIENIRKEADNPGSPLAMQWTLGFAARIRAAPFAE